MDLTYYGHSCFAVEVSGKTLLFDPFITPNELARHIDANALKPDYVLISHGHEDHIADAVSILQRSGAKAICAWEIHVWLQNKGITNTHPMNTGGKWNFDFGTVKCVIAHHSSGLPDGTYGGNPMGFVVTEAATGKSFYYAGDTALTYDMKRIAEQYTLTFAVLPIGDNFTMDAAEAAVAADYVNCKHIIGCHYDTFGFIKINHDEAIATFAQSGKTLQLLNIGETVSL
jgi:L-ascorbate metabolism protein UlaG (beta-lactamase superfamily)